MNISKFISKKISALLLTLICILTLAACAGGGGGGSNPPPAGPSLLNLRIIPDTNNATLIWDNPAANITQISITYRNATAADFEEPVNITAPDTRVTANATVTKMITNLTDGSTYTFRVALEFGGDDVNKSSITDEIMRQIGPNLDQDDLADAVDKDDDGDGVNDDIDAFPRNRAISAFMVTELTATPGNSSVTLSWTNPVANISSISISYHNTNAPNDLQRHPSIEDSPRTNSSATNVEETIDGLVNGQSYNFTVSLTLDRDDAGKKVVVASTTAIPGIFAVTNLVATPGAGNVTLRWINPAADIASINISYEVTDSGVSTTVGASNTGRGASVEQTITGLTNGRSYTFTVSLTLTGANIDDEVMAASDTATPNVFSVANLVATPGAGNVTLSWNNPDADIASINISYEITGSNDVQYWDLITPPAQMETITGLTNGQSYTFNISLTLQNDDAGREGEAASDTATPNVFSVIDLTATPGAGNVTLSWNNPDADIASISISYKIGGSSTSTTVRPSNTGRNASVEQTIGGLMNGVLYNFTVSLTLRDDDAGREGEAPSVTATPGVSVAGLTATPGAGSVILNWNNPDADIASISISYEVTGSGASTTVAASNTGRGASVEQTITGLTNGQSYTFNISLTLQNDDAGREGEAASATATPNVFSVTDLTAIPNDSSVTLSWNNPDADIASISISYKIDGSSASTTVGAGNTGRVASVEETIPGLTNEEYYNFTVDLTLEGDDTGREGVPLSIRLAIGPNLDGDEYADFVDNDIDGDNTLNTADVDADGDGLIEIATAAQLDQIRYNLLGSSLNTSDGVAGDASGCGGQPDISECNGYELTQNISLDGYNSDNWIPIGICRGVRTCNSESSFFDAIFDGNGWTISNLTITNPAALYNNATGLFGAISPDSILRNIHIRSANISGVMNNVGLLAGSAVGAKISNSSVEGEVTARGGQVGGLVGIGDRATITLSYAKFSSVRGDVNVGGLVGFGEDATITSSYATGGSVRGRGEVGGLVGRGDSAEIMSSYAEVGAVSGSFNYAGGMIGLGQGVTITSSYAKVGAVSGSRNLGGLVGGGQSATITSSYAEVGSINGSSTTSGGIGGLVGTTTTAKGSVTIISSYAATGTLSNASSENTLGGLLGFGTLNAASSNSYWNSDTSGVTRTIGSTTGNSEGRTTAQLQILTDFIGIYATWATNMCDDGSRAWNLGLNDQYPALTCTPGGKDAQRP